MYRHNGVGQAAEIRLSDPGRRQTLETRHMKAFNFASILCGAVALMAGCSTPPKPPEAPVAAAPAPAPAAKPAAKAESSVATVTLPDYLDPKNPLSTNRSVFFDFDDFSIKSEFTPLVERHGKFLSGHPAVSIKVEGNADERGSHEYNLALGQKRAQAVVAALKVYGVKDGQVEAISWGEERPRAAGHDEADWSQNRRADLSYPAK
jgi:peptidoglycan-associated lipoprotein